jgi:hypothetical protein
VTAIPLGRAAVRRLTTRSGTRLAATAIVALVIALGLMLSLGTASQDDALSDAAGAAEPLTVAAQDIYRGLSDADVTAAQLFLSGAQASTADQDRYNRDIQQVSASLAEIGADAGSSSRVRSAAGVIVADLPIYTGLVGTAQADARQDLPVGAAYLREASSLLRHRVLPAAQQALAAESDRLDGDGSAGSADLAGEGAVLLLTLAVLVVVQAFLTRRTNRLVNPGIAAATVLVFGLACWTAFAAPGERSAVASAQSHRAAVNALVTTDLTVIQAHGDELLSLAARGEDVGSYETDFGKDSAAATKSLAADPGAEIGDATAAYRGWLTEHDTLVRLETAPEPDNSANVQALALATGAAPGGSGAAFARVDGDLRAAADREQAGYLSEIAASRSDLGGLAAGAAALAALALFTGAFGINQRLRDYR